MIETAPRNAVLELGWWEYSQAEKRLVWERAMGFAKTGWLFTAHHPRATHWRFPPMPPESHDAELRHSRGKPLWTGC